MAAIGLAASTILHEVNQPMTVIKICCNIILDILKKSKKETIDPYEKVDMQKNFESILIQTNRIDQIVRNLRLFNSGNLEKIPKEQFNPNSVIQRVVENHKNELDSLQIEITCKTNSSGSVVEGYPTLFSQVIQNIFQNSIHALAQLSDQSERKININSKLSKNQLLVSISDNGKGVPGEIMDKIVDPFFTTKSFDAGSGLGLALCLNVITKMDGKMSMSNIKPQGLKTDISLPANPIQVSNYVSS